MGVLVWQSDPEDIRGMQHLPNDAVTLPEVQRIMGAGPVREDFWDCDEFYVAQPFASLRRPGSWSTFPVNQIFWQMGRTVWGMREDATVVRTTAFVPGPLLVPKEYGFETPEEHQALVSAFAPFRLAMMLSRPFRDPYWPFRVPWPVLMQLCTPAL